ncbi:hypothetical protein Purlil1_11665 [Purpureocillium lilacinum]|uniref:Uncharacterized protein n=1 Tax=Purpureocillium lilacinum TaxID=33203 RepID=A0ABR0BJC1_PURLI|nr:hypothetical protein Purlil1_11665 [Purpureocillium lilacinum]
MWNNEFRDGFKAWWAAGHKVTPMKLLYTGLGSIEDPFNMTNCEKMLNSMKARVWGLQDPVSVEKWDASCSRMTKKSSENALTALLLLQGVWQYLQADGVRAKLLAVHIAVAEFLQEFERLYREETAAPYMDLEGSHWQHLNTLLKQASNGADVANDIGLATQILTDLRIRTAELANV